MNIDQVVQLLFNAVERQLTQLLKSELENPEDWPSQVVDEALGRMKSDPRSGVTDRSFIDYLFFQQKVEAVPRNEQLLRMTPSGSAFVVNSKDLISLYGLRNDVAHPRKLQEADADRLIQVCQSLVQNGLGGGEVSELLNQLDPRDFQSQVSSAFSDVLHNLPNKEYDDTGFVGRTGLITQVVKDLKSKSSFNSYIWLTGLGGFGKTAVAREVAERLLWDTEKPFDVILWISFKNHELSIDGAIQIRNSIFSAAEMISETQIFSPTESPNLSELFKELGELETLIILDNCETYPGQISEITDANPPNSIRFLFTSRQRGEFGRFISIENFDFSECRLFLSKLNKTYPSSEISELLKNEQKLQQTFSLIGQTPLGIKWLVRACNTGQTIEAVLSNRESFYRYCVENVYKDTPILARTILHFLYFASAPLSIGDLKVVLDDIHAEDLLSNISILGQAGLAKPVSNEFRQVYTVDDTTRDFLLLASPIDSEEAHEIRRSLNKFQKRIKYAVSEVSYSPYSVDGRDIEPGVQFELARLLKKPNAKEGLNRIELVKRARDLIDSAPRYWETHRVLGEILSWFGDISQSISYHEDALRICPPERTLSLSRLHFFLGLKLLQVDEHRASDEFRLAFELHKCHASCLQYGRSLVFIGQYQDSLKFLEQSFQLAENQNEQHFASRAIFEAHKRFCETASLTEKFRVSSTALNYLLQTPELIFECPPTREKDLLRVVLDVISYWFTSCTHNKQFIENKSEQEKYDELLVRVHNHLKAWGFEDWPRTIETPQRRVLQIIKERLTSMPNLQREIGFKVADALVDLGQVVMPEISGRLKVWYGDMDRKFGFMYATIDGDEREVYFNLKEFVNKTDEYLLSDANAIVTGELQSIDDRLFLMKVRVNSTSLIFKP